MAQDPEGQGEHCKLFPLLPPPHPPGHTHHAQGSQPHSSGPTCPLARGWGNVELTQPPTSYVTSGKSLSRSDTHLLLWGYYGDLKQ